MSDVYSSKLAEFNSARKIIKYLVIAVAFSSLSTVVLLGFLLFNSSSNKVEYFAATEDGRLIEMRPLNEPVYTDAAIIQWASSVINTTFDYSYSNINSHFRKLEREYFKPDAINSLISNMQKNGTWEKIVEDKIFVQNILNGNPVIDDIFMKNGTVNWVIRAAVRITYTNGHVNKKNQKLESSHIYGVKMVVSRVNDLSNTHGLRVSMLSVGKGGFD